MIYQNIQKIFKLIILLAIITFISCDKKGIGDVLTYSKNNKVHAVIQIPSGTAKIYVYDYIQKGFKNKVENSIETKYDFLPLPFNYGFLPSTKMLDNDDKNLAIESIVLSEMYSIGTLIETDVLGSLEYTKDNKTNIIVIQNPIYDDAKLIHSENMIELQEKYPDIITIIQLYFENSFNYEFTKIISKEETEILIKKHIIRKI